MTAHPMYEALRKIAALEVEYDNYQHTAVNALRSMGRIARQAIVKALRGPHAYVPCPEPQARCLAEDFEVGPGRCHQILSDGVCGEVEFDSLHEPEHVAEPALPPTCRRCWTATMLPTPGYPHDPGCPKAGVQPEIVDHDFDAAGCSCGECHHSVGSSRYCGRPESAHFNLKAIRR